LPIIIGLKKAIQQYKLQMGYLKGVYTGSIKEKLFTVAFLIMGIYPLIPQKAESFSVILFISLTGIIFLLNNKKSIAIKPLLISSSLFIIIFLSMLFSDDKNAGLKKTETMLSLIIFPIVFSIFLENIKTNYKRLLNLFFKTFFISNVIYALIAFYFISKYRSPKFPIKDASFFRAAVSDIPLIGEHPIYLSIFLSIAILFGIHLFKKARENKVNNSLVFLGLIVILYLLILLMSKGVIIALFVALLVLLLSKIKKKYIILLFFSFFLVVIFLPESNNRFNELFSKETYNSTNLNNSTNIRVNILKCSIDKALENPFFGYGIGDVQGELDNCYENKRLKYKIGKYNSHNQYLFIWLSTGVFGLLLFVFYLVFYFKIAITYKDYLMLSTIVLYVIAFLFENVLSRQSGVILFSFLINFMVWRNTRINQTFYEQ